MDSDRDLRNSLIEKVTLNKDLKELRELTVYSGRREFQTERAASTKALNVCLLRLKGQKYEGQQGWNSD